MKLKYTHNNRSSRVCKNLHTLGPSKQLTYPLLGVMCNKQMKHLYIEIFQKMALSIVVFIVISFMYSSESALWMAVTHIWPYLTIWLLLQIASVSYRRKTFFLFIIGGNFIEAIKIPNSIFSAVFWIASFFILQHQYGQGMW